MLLALDAVEAALVAAGFLADVFAGTFFAVVVFAVLDFFAVDFAAGFFAGADAVVFDVVALEEVDASGFAASAFGAVSVNFSLAEVDGASAILASPVSRAPTVEAVSCVDVVSGLLSPRTVLRKKRPMTLRRKKPMTQPIRKAASINNAISIKCGVFIFVPSPQNQLIVVHQTRSSSNR